MKSVFQAVLFLGLVTPSFSAAPNIDFDGATNKREGGVSISEAIKNASAELSNSEINQVQTPPKEEADGSSSIQLFEIKDGKKELVRPLETSDGKASFEYMPNAYRVWKLSCTGQTTGSWGVCWSTDFRPSTGGHNHSPATPLSYINPANGQLLPREICKNSTVNTPIEIDYKAPGYSTLVLSNFKFYGKCQQPLTAESYIKVTAQNLIQLNEFQPEPYFVFKEADGNHSANRFATPDTNAKLKKIAWEYYSVYKPTTTEKMITINDMGLVWGGRYNTFEPYNCWVNGNEHFYHRYGRQVDVRSWNIPQANRACFKEIACKYQVHPILEGKAPGTIPERDYSNISLFEADVLDKTEHYHLNFTRPTDPQVDPADDARTSCSSFIPPEVSACPKLGAR